METENKKIPFDWEKYQSGEFEAVCRDGEKPEQITYNSKAEPYPIGAWVDVRMCTFDNKGKYSIFDKEHSYDLFLIPKPKKFQAWVNLYSNGNITYHLIESESKDYKNMLAIKGIKCVETRLIEWEG
jgi:lipocalin